MNDTNRPNDRQSESFTRTEQQYGGREAYQQAEADGQTELDYRQWVQVRTPEFKAWFGDWENDPDNASKAVNPKTGEPWVVYHGSPSDFTVFDPKKSGIGNDAGMRSKGFYLSPNEKTSANYGENVMPVFANLRKPFIPFAFSSASEIAESVGVEESTFRFTPGSDFRIGQPFVGTFTSALKNADYDGVLYLHRQEIIAYDPNQIKSATGNIGTFSRHNNDIYDTPPPLDQPPQSLETEISRDSLLGEPKMADMTEPSAPKDTRVDFAEQVAQRLIEQLKQGTAPWQKPWSPADGDDLPHNPITGGTYSGINQLSLMMHNRTDPRWMTFKQAKAAGMHVRKGEKGVPIIAVRRDRVVTERDSNGQIVKDENGQPVTQRVMLDRPIIKSFTVFNGEQIEGIDPLPAREPKAYPWQPHERAEAILSASGADITHQKGDQAYYAPLRDEIVLPEKQQFDTQNAYYGTALHELGHWTGHSSRLDRDLSHVFGSTGYAREELRAEIASMMLSREIGVPHHPDRHASYVASWIKVLQDNPQEIMKAAADAKKIRDFVTGLEQTQQQNITLSSDKQPDISPAEDYYRTTRALPDYMIHRDVEVGTLLSEGGFRFDNARIVEVDHPEAEVVLSARMISPQGDKIMRLSLDRETLRADITRAQDSHLRRYPEAWQVNQERPKNQSEQILARLDNAREKYQAAFDTAAPDEKRVSALRSGMMEELIGHIHPDQHSNARIGFYEAEAARLSPPLNQEQQRPAQSQGVLFTTEEAVEMER